MIRKNEVVVITVIFLLNAAGLFYVLSHINNQQLYGTYALTYTLGLRHGFDPDHISAIDCATRLLRIRDKSAASTGLLFSIGHSIAIFILLIIIDLIVNSTPILAAASTISSLISPLLLLALGLVNITTLISTVRSRAMANTLGIVKFVNSAISLTETSWIMLPVGILFGLGFITATEASILTFSVGPHLGESLMLFLAFASGMVLVDGLDGVLANRAYSKTLLQARFTYYVVVTLASAIMAISIGIIDILGVEVDTETLGILLVAILAPALILASRPRAAQGIN